MEIKIPNKHTLSLKYAVGKDSEVHNYVPTISQSEDDIIRQWVDDNYALYSDAYKKAAYKDAQQAVLNRKASVDKKNILLKERKERAERAAYQWTDLTLNQQKQIAAAENAISDAAELIRKWQEMNWVKVDNTLTDRELVNAFLEANTEAPFWEYVNKFLDTQTWNWDKSIYHNRWLAAKLWLAWKAETLWVNTTDKVRAWASWFMQWTTDLAQNTLWAWAEWLWSRLGAWLWELWYWAAKLLWADVSEWTIWDKMKKAKWYTWEEAKEKANSDELRRDWLISENEWAYNIGRAGWQLATEIALTAPLEMWVWARIAWSSAPWIVKFLWQWANAFAGWLAFQLADDATEWELSWLGKYMTTGTISALTAWIFTALSKIPRVARKWWYKLFAPKWQDETALLTQTSDDWARKTAINKWYAQNKNATKTPYTEIADDLEKVSNTTYWTRVTKWWKLEEVEKALTYWENPYTAREVVQDLQAAFSTLWWWPKAKLPKFKISWNKLKINKEWLKTLNSITRTQDGVSIKLWDEILDAWDSTFTRLDRPIDAQNTNIFINKLKWILWDAWYSKSWWETIRAMKNALNWVDWWKWIISKFNNSLSKKSANALAKAKSAAWEAIKTDENVNKLVGVLRNADTVEWVWAAEKALWGKASMEQLFKEIYEKYGIDMNNEILAWAYNMSLYDVKKAEQILTTFYPSKPWVIELLLRQITKAGRKKAADALIEKWAEWVAKLWTVPTRVPVEWWIAWAATSSNSDINLY